MARTPRILRGIWSKMNGKLEIEVSEELTNAYFGNPKAWRIQSDAEVDSTDKENQEP